MYKKVNIIPTAPIYTLAVPVTSALIGVQMSVGDIARCIHARAKVTEILEGGTIVKLDLSNYDKDNAKNILVEETVEPEIEINVITKVEDAKPVQEIVTTEVKTVDSDPKYFNENEKQKSKIEAAPAVDETVKSEVADTQKNKNKK